MSITFDISEYKFQQFTSMPSKNTFTPHLVHFSCKHSIANNLLVLSKKLFNLLYFSNLYRQTPTPIEMLFYLIRLSTFSNIHSVVSFEYTSKIQLTPFQFNIQYINNILVLFCSVQLCSLALVVVYGVINKQCMYMVYQVVYIFSIRSSICMQKIKYTSKTQKTRTNKKLTFHRL